MSEAEERCNDRKTKSRDPIEIDFIHTFAAIVAEVVVTRPMRRSLFASLSVVWWSIFVWLAWCCLRCPFSSCHSIYFVSYRLKDWIEVNTCCCRAAVLLGSMLPQCIEFRARYRLYACSRAHVLRQHYIVLLFLLLRLSAIVCWTCSLRLNIGVAAVVSVHTHRHTREPIIFPRCAVDSISFVDVMVFLCSGALKTTYEIAIIFLFISFATRTQKRFRCRDGSFSDESIEYWITIQFYLILFALAMLDKWQTLYARSDASMLNMLANLRLIKRHAHCALWPLEWELIRRSDDNNVMRSRKKK